MAAMAVPPAGAVSVSPFPPAWLGHMAWGRWRGDDLHTFTNQAAARVKQPGANPVPVSLPCGPVAGDLLGHVGAHRREAAVPAPALPRHSCSAPSGPFSV